LLLFEVTDTCIVFPRRRRLYIEEEKKRKRKGGKGGDPAPGRFYWFGYIGVRSEVNEDYDIGGGEEKRKEGKTLP